MSGREWVLEPDEASFRTVLGHFATGVAIVTACDGDEPVGMACNSFSSVSLDPPLVLFCPAKSSSTWARMEGAGFWAASFLREDAEDVCRLFATKGADRFGRIAHHAARSGAPILDDALAYVDCVTEAVHDAGDHLIVVGRVVQLGVGEEGRPLLFYRGGYGRFEA